MMQVSASCRLGRLAILIDLFFSVKIPNHIEKAKLSMTSANLTETDANDLTWQPKLPG